MNEKQEYPSLIQQGKNLAKFSWDLIKYLQQEKNFMSLFVDDDVYERRIDLCKACDKYDPEEHRCRECGCFLEQKARIILDSCPLSKWGPEDSQWEETFSKIASDIENQNNDQNLTESP